MSKNQAAVIAEAIKLKNSGLTWPKVAAVITSLGLLDDNGKPYHNAAIASMVLNSPTGGHLRTRFYSKKKRRGRPVGSKSRPKSGSTLQTSGIVDVVQFVTEMQGKGYSTRDIRELVSKLF